MQPVSIAGLATRIVGPADAKLTVVLLHGFGAPGDDLVALGDFLARVPGLPPTRFVFPAAPLELSQMYGDARAWWLLDLAKLEEDMRRGVPRDRRDEVPAGLAEVRATVTSLLAEVQAKFAVPDGALVLGGFSQGAMLSLDVALHRAQPLAGLVLMSGTLLAEQEWKPRMAKLAGVPVVMSHGRADALLPFAIAETLRDQLLGAGADVAWQPFAGGHEIPRSVLDAVGALLTKLAR